MLPVDDGYSLPATTERPEPPVRLTGRTARRSPRPVEHTVWDNELPGFGLRIYPSGQKSWIVQHRRRGKTIKVTLGRAAELRAEEARRRAREVLVEAALDGLPKPAKRRATAPAFTDYIEMFWRDYARHWKPSTARSNRRIMFVELDPVFGSMTIDAITRADVLRWRDDMSGRQGSFNRALPVLAIMLAYAEQLGHRPRGSNPCRGTPRYKRTLPERYLSRAEYRRLGSVLRDAEQEYPASVAIIRLLLLTGARRSEIVTLRWEEVQPPRLKLADSKTGPKTVYLNASAAAVLAGIALIDGSPYVFPDRSGTEPMTRLERDWTALRRRAALPDVRLHDLRHSFASTAINANMSLTLIGGLFGHALPETTARYAHLADQSVADAAGRVCATLAWHLGGER